MCKHQKIAIATHLGFSYQKLCRLCL